ncbi:MAG TPA: ATP-dependent RecD-like DNA helicase [Candidatus Coprocola pullicola]|nr:ATP-dependent RecD-like DNA helicase [Candidatus Coprocola pullicola]
MEQKVLHGTIEDIIFQNIENGYAVFTVSSGETQTTCVGIVPHLHTGESVEISGNWTVHATYGKQFQVQSYEKSIPTTEEGIEKYLASGVIKGIGAKTAKKIVERFGEDSFYIIEEKTERLAEIKGITLEKALKIGTLFREQHQQRKAMLFLQDFGVTPTFAMKIYKKYKDRTFDVVKNNPYRLADDILGIGFKMADKMAAAAGIPFNSSDRICSAIKFVLNKAVNNGNVFLPKQMLLQQTQELLQLYDFDIENYIKELQINNQVWQEKREGIDYVYLTPFYYAEIAVAKKMLELAEDFEYQNGTDIEKAIEKVEQQTGILLAQQQKKAVIDAMTYGVLIITGGPGTGKTTTINTILKILQEEENDILLAAPTGRAAKRMTEATGMEAQTIHRMLGINFVNEDSRRQTFDKNEENPIDADIIIIDESSMIDISLMHSLLKAISPGTRLILVGDVDQLPSVGAGNVLKDLILSEKLPVVRLEQIFRQAQESAIIMNAHRINQGKTLVLNEKEKDFFFVKRAYSEDVVRAIVELATKRLPKFMNCHSVKDIQVLTPMRKSPIGVQNLNMVLQQALNPPEEGKNEKAFRNITFREGDKVMQIKNNYNIVWKIYTALGKVKEEGVGIFNGDEGTITNIDDVNETLDVTFDDEKCVTYDFTQLEELELAYAITIHKSQGSEYPVVIIPIHNGPPMLMTRNLLYTAVTRAKQLVVLVGLEEKISAMVANKREIDRYSSLAYRLKSLHDFMQGIV